MLIKRIELTHFKNHQKIEFYFNEKVNCITGLNGSGKTNLLDAIYFVAFTKSFLNHQDSQCIKFNENFFSIHAEIKNNNLLQYVKLVQTINEKKQVYFNNNPVKKFSDYIGTVPLIMIAPQDILLPAALAEERRRFIDAFISQYNKVYLQQLMIYNRAIEQRNKLLRNFTETNFIDDDLLNSYDLQLIDSAEFINKQREDFILQIKSKLLYHYKQICSIDEEVDITYTSALNIEPMSKLLLNNLQQDLAAQRTTQGIHKDDFLFFINNQLLKRFGSQGQQKSFLIALKLAMYELLKDKKATPPLLLIDDMLEKLDNIRIQRLINLMNSDFFGQIFITHTDATLLKQLFEHNKIDVSFFEINKIQDI